MGPWKAIRYQVGSPVAAFRERIGKPPFCLLSSVLSPSAILSSSLHASTPIALLTATHHDRLTSISLAIRSYRAILGSQLLPIPPIPPIPFQFVNAITSHLSTPFLHFLPRGNCLSISCKRHRQDPPGIFKRTNEARFFRSV